MAPINVFVLGATGFIGGDAFYAITHAHPEYELVCLVRNSDKGATIAKDYPSVRLVYGDLDSHDLIAGEAAKANIVCNFANADHAGAVSAIIEGLKRETSAPKFYIHTSGTGILLIDDIKSGVFGETSDKVYDDLEGVSKLTSMPDDAPHRDVDKLVLAAGATEGGHIKTAIVCPGTIYSAGRGPDNKRSHQVPELARVTLEKGYGVKVNAGRTYWNNVHVHDLSNLYLKLVEEAAAGGSTAEWADKPAVWGKEGYYLCEGGEHIWGEVAQLIATEAHKQGLIQAAEVKSISTDEAAAATRGGHAMWGANSRARAKRARIALKWEPKEHGIGEGLDAVVEVEAKRLGLKPGHAKVAAGEV